MARARAKLRKLGGYQQSRVMQMARLPLAVRPVSQAVPVLPRQNWRGLQFNNVRRNKKPKVFSNNGNGSFEGLSVNAKAWFIAILDPNHDYEYALAKYPGHSNDYSFVYKEKFQQDLTLPNGVCDVHIASFPEFATNYTIVPMIRTQSTNTYTDSAFHEATLRYTFGSVTANVVKAGNKTFEVGAALSTSVATYNQYTPMPNNTDLLTFATSCKARLIAQAVEVENTTSMLNQNGKVVCYRQNQYVEREFANFSVTTVATPEKVDVKGAIKKIESISIDSGDEKESGEISEPIKAAKPFKVDPVLAASFARFPETPLTTKVDKFGTTVVTYSSNLIRSAAPPETVADASIIPNAVTMDGKAGAYTVNHMTEDDSKYQAMTPCVRIFDHNVQGGTSLTSPNVFGSAFTYDGSTPGPGLFIPQGAWDSTGIYFAGLAANSTLAVTVTRLVEFAPYNNTAYSHLASPAAMSEGSVVSDYFNIARSLPTAVPFAENGFGDWWRRVVAIGQKVSKYLQPFVKVVGNALDVASTVTGLPIAPVGRLLASGSKAMFNGMNNLVNMVDPPRS